MNANTSNDCAQTATGGINRAFPDSLQTAKTYDGVILHIYADGAVTGALGACIRGVGVSRSETAQDRDLHAGRWFMADAFAYDFREVATALNAARKLARSRDANNLPTTADYRKAAGLALRNKGGNA